METEHFGTRLRIWTGLVYATRFKACVALEIQPPTLYRYFKAENAPGSEFLTRLASEGCSISWLLTGEGSIFSESDTGMALAKQFRTDEAGRTYRIDGPSSGHAKSLDEDKGKRRGSGSATGSDLDPQTAE